MKQVLDLHIHSRFSRACSSALTIPNIAAAAARKGIDIVGTGDFTHPAWREEIGRDLEEKEEGLFGLKHPPLTPPLKGGESENDFPPPRGRDEREGVRFMLTTELSCIYKRGGKVRRVHNVICAPSLAAVDAIIASLTDRGCNLNSDGRPILGLDSEELLKIVLHASPDCLLIPAHAWTPWFAIFGSESGFDSIEECFGSLSSEIHAIETGLSSDPAMNWRLSKLDDIMLVSNSDAHSAGNLGREANVMDMPDRTYRSYSDILRKRQHERFLYTIEFFPEEGKYHFDGHRACEVRLSPPETKKHNLLCPKCKKPLTVGVMHRVEALADRPEGFRPPTAIAFKSLVPLAEVVGEALGKGKATKGAQKVTDELVATLGSEFSILLDVPLDEIRRAAPPEVAEAIRRVREGRLHIEPGYDGEYGTVRIFSPDERKAARQGLLF